MAQFLERGWLAEAQRDVQREIKNWPKEMKALRSSATGNFVTQKQSASKTLTLKAVSSRSPKK